jgi:hypothetical protein
MRFGHDASPESAGTPLSITGVARRRGDGTSMIGPDFEVLFRIAQFAK